jgi:UDP-N-acetylglucosamine 2-epimerase (non-hydrolysing)
VSGRHVVGARPNFPKLAPVLRAGRLVAVEQVVVHTGQHYDAFMSSSFFDDLGIAPPDHNLKVGSGSHAVQTARIMERFEPVLARHRPDWLVVSGDVNSRMATALVAAKLGVRIAHVEPGSRSGDRAMLNAWFDWHAAGWQPAAQALGTPAAQSFTRSNA